MTLPRMANSLNSLSMGVSSFVLGGPVVWRSVARIISKENQKPEEKRLRGSLARSQINAEPTRPRSASKTPANASNGPTHSKGTREIASITKPSRVNDSPRVHCS